MGEFIKATLYALSFLTLFVPWLFVGRGLIVLWQFRDPSVVSTVAHLQFSDCHPGNDVRQQSDPIEAFVVFNQGEYE